MADVDPYVYPGTQVLRNRFDIRDAAELADREGITATLRAAQLELEPIPGRYDLAHLQAMHAHIFGDVYPWAGELRTVAIAKGDLFALPQHIQPYLNGVLSQLPRENYLKGAGQDQVVDRLTYYLGEINSTHPFREGNGRTQRAFITQLAHDAGYEMDWTRLDPQRNLEVSQASHRGNDAPLRAALEQLTVPTTSSHAQDIRDRRAAAFPESVAKALGQSHHVQARRGGPGGSAQGRGRGR